MAWIELVYWPLFAGNLGFYLANMYRRMAVRGTQPRYRFASACRVLQYPCLAFGPYCILYHSLEGLYGFYSLDSFIFLLAWLSVKNFRKDDDEDFWSKLKKGLRARLVKAKARLGELGAAPLPSPA